MTGGVGLWRDYAELSHVLFHYRYAALLTRHSKYFERLGYCYVENIVNSFIIEWL